MSFGATSSALKTVHVYEQSPAIKIEKSRSVETLTLVGPSRTAQIIGLLIICALVFGFWQRRTEYFVPGEGIGYQLGLTGGTMMLLVLFYPLVKRIKFFGARTNASFWFRWHMMLGTIGPVLIFYHSNFSLGAMNSNVALFTMILVAVSGIIGRYIYGQVHNGMSGARLDVGGLLAKATRLMAGIEGDVGGNGGSLAKALADFSDSALPKSSKFIPNMLNTMLLPLKIKFARTRIMAEVRSSVKINSRLHNWSRSEERSHIMQARLHVLDFMNSVSRAAQLTLWERMFSLWHVFHVPLFFLLLVSGVIHVIAVHLY
jgi:hypothetical protein